LHFKPLNKIFYSEGTVRHSNGISNIIFELKQKHIRINSKIKIYRKTLNKKDIIYEENFHKLIKNNQIIFGKKLQFLKIKIV